MAPNGFLDPKTIKPTDWDALVEQSTPKKATRADLIRLVNLWLLRRSQRDNFPRKLLTGKHWQRAVFIARQNKLLRSDVLDDLAQKGWAIR